MDDQVTPRPAARPDHRHHHDRPTDRSARAGSRSSIHVIDGRIYITGMPRADRKRAWLLNLEADPRLTFHLKGAGRGGPARHGPGRSPTRPSGSALADWVATQRLARARTPRRWPPTSPMIEVTPDDLAA